MKITLTLLLFLLLHPCANGQPQWGDWQRWGEQADGTYRNPIIPSDYSDLDCIRVGKDYYAISSTMQYSPGMTVLHSRDLVNWEIAGNAVPDLTEISPQLNWDKMNRYGRGIWAGTLRHHQGRFYLYFGTPDEGYFMTTSRKAEGPWRPLTCLMPEAGWDDCTVFWDDDGKAYFLGTQFSDGYKTYLFDMSPDGRSIDRQSARLVNEGNGREASKIVKHGDYYYIIFSEYRGRGRYVMGKRDKSMRGNFEEEKQLLRDNVDEHEPNQGGIVLGPDGKWYFLTHHGNGDWSGRVVSLLPVTWKDGWPMMGDLSEGGLGKMVWQAPMPKRGGRRLSLQRSDDFSGRVLQPQWQWNYQPRRDMYSLSERRGWMRLYAFRPIETDRLLKAGNTLTQRSFRNGRNVVTVKMDISHMAEGQKAGLCHMAEHSGGVGVSCRNGQIRLETRQDDSIAEGAQIASALLWLRSEWSLDGHSRFSYSTDGLTYHHLSDYTLSWGFYRGDRIGIYNFNNISDAGFVDIDYLHYDF